MNDLNDLDFIGKYENLENDVSHIIQVLGIKCTKLPHRNKTIQCGYQNYYTPATEMKVAFLYRDDIKEFGYSFK